MAGEWPTYSVRSLVEDGVLDRPMDGNHGEIHPRGNDFVSHGIPFITASDVRDGRVDTTGCAFITEERAKNLRKGFAHSGDVLISHKATMGRTALVGQLDVPFLMLTPQVTYYRVLDEDRLDRRFLRFYFDSPAFQSLFETWGQKGSTRAYLGITSQLDLPIALPPIDEQRAIAHILGTLDDKIELNRRMNETLEQIARALFKSWFVDFDPARAKSEDRDPGLPSEIAALFPDAFEESELGEIPKGWRVGRIGEFATLSRDGVNPGEFPDEAFDHFSIPAFDDGRRPKTELGVQIKSNKYLVPDISVLLSKLNPRIPRIWMPVVKDGARAVCSTEFLVALPRGGISREFLFCLFSSDAFTGVFETLATGTSGSHQRVNPDGLLRMDAVVPDGQVIQRFTSSVRPLLEKVDRGREGADTLADLRGALLPKLISGELRVKDA